MTRKSSKGDKDAARAEASPASGTSIEALHREAESRVISCARIEAAIDNYIQEEKAHKHNILSHCDEAGDCSCGRSGGKKLVDLIILIDSSGSMGSAGKAVAAAAKDALAGAEKECPSDLRVVWLTVDGSKTGANPAGFLGDITPQLVGTNFTQTHQQYLDSIGSTGPFQQDAPQPTGDTTYPGEEGADAIADLSNFFDWRPTACKSIFYISDTSLDGLGQDAVDVAASVNASTAATAHGVVIFAHKINPGSPTGPPVNSSYTNMCSATGGSAYIGSVDTDQYKILIKDAICKACGAECKEAELPKAQPCVSIAWGDSDCDCFETDDVETAIVSICNCYSNLTFSNVHISYFFITMADGTAVPVLPDGTPSVQIVPIGPICFGDIGPCKEGGTNCVSREIIIRTRGAKSGKYKILVGGICYQIVLDQMYSECFELTLCQD